MLCTAARVASVSTRGYGILPNPYHNTELSFQHPMGIKYAEVEDTGHLVPSRAVALPRGDCGICDVMFPFQCPVLIGIRLYLLEMLGFSLLRHRPLALASFDIVLGE